MSNSFPRQCVFCPGQNLIIRDVLIGNCEKCNTQYTYTVSEKLKNYWFIVTYREQEYMLYFDVMNNLFSVEKVIGHDASYISSELNPIVELTWSPNITPFNWQTKLPTLLVFS